MPSDALDVLQRADVLSWYLGWYGAHWIHYTVWSLQAYFCVTQEVMTYGASIYSVQSVSDLTCPYCGTKEATEPDQNYILEDHSYKGED